MIKLNSLTCIFFYLILFTAIAFLSPSLPTGLSTPFSSHSTILQIHNYWGSSDVGLYALGGWIIFSKGWFDANTIGLISFWPPGFMVLQAIILKIFGPAAPVVITIQVLAALFLALTCNFFRLCIKLFLRKEYAFFLPLILLFFPQFRMFMLDRSAVLFGETFAISLTLTGFFCLILACAKNNKILALIAGGAFALSAYFRPTFETFLTIASLNFLLIFFLLHAYKKIKLDFAFQDGISNNSALIKLNPLIAIFLAIITFHVLTMPYRIYTYMRTGSPSWVQDGPTMWQQNFTSTETLTKEGGGFEAMGMGNTACRVDPTLCTQLSKQINHGTISPNELRKYVFQTLYKHPLRWIYIKYNVLPKYWFATVNNFWDMVAYSKISTLSAYFENLIFFGCFVFSIAWVFCTLRNPYSFITYWLSSSIFIAYAIIFLFAHYEVRYFFFFKFYFLVTAILGLAQSASTRYPRLSSNAVK